MPTINEVLQQGWQLHQAGRIDEAAELYRNVLAQVPQSADALVYLGIAQFDQRKFDESVDSYREAIHIRRHFPIAWNNLGNSLRMLGEIDEAESCFAKSLQQQPGYLSALKNRGTLWVWCGEIERGLKWYEEGLKTDPDNAELHRNLGVIQLLLGNFDVGWTEYRWRWRMPGMARPDTSAPFWQGEELNGKTVLLYPEQGRGDTIQFARMSTVLHDVGARVIFQCSAEMIPLLQSIRGVEMFLPTGSVIPPIDYHLSFIDAVDVWYFSQGGLPLGIDTNDGYLRVADSQIEQWQKWLDTKSPKKDGKSKRIGINWQGNPEHHADIYRSVPLDALRPLSKLPDTQLISLQFGYGAADIDACDFSESILRLPEGIDGQGQAFMDTAAILKCLDGVVTSDTAIAHLAGALGVRADVMLGKVPDWRWGLESETTPWYSSMKLLRQSQMGDWSDVVAQVVADLSS